MCYNDTAVYWACEKMVLILDMIHLLLFLVDDVQDCIIDSYGCQSVTSQKKNEIVYLLQELGFFEGVYYIWCYWDYRQWYQHQWHSYSW